MIHRMPYADSDGRRKEGGSMSAKREANSRFRSYKQDAKAASGNFKGPFSYAAWVGMCVDTFVQSGMSDLPEAERDKLLAQCPKGQEKEGEEFLQTLPEVALALSSWQQPEPE